MEITRHDLSRILITGASGFLGSTLKILLENQGENIRSFTRNAPVWPDAENIHSIFHVAARVAYGLDDSPALYEDNVVLTRNICQRFPAAKINFASSVSVFGWGKGNIISENTPVQCNTPYPLSKLWAEAFIQQHAKWTITRFSSIYGPGMQETTFIPRVVHQALTTGEIVIWGNGQRKQNYIHVEEAARLMMLANKATENGIFLGVGEREFSNAQVAEIVAGITGAKVKFQGTDPSPSVQYSNEETKAVLNWKPAITFETGLAQYIEWKKRQLL